MREARLARSSKGFNGRVERGERVSKIKIDFGLFFCKPRKNHRDHSEMPVNENCVDIPAQLERVWSSLMTGVGGRKSGATRGAASGSSLFGPSWHSRQDCRSTRWLEDQRPAVSGGCEWVRIGRWVADLFPSSTGDLSKWEVAV